MGIADRLRGNDPFTEPPPGQKVETSVAVWQEIARLVRELPGLGLSGYLRCPGCGQWVRFVAYEGRRGITARGACEGRGCVSFMT